MAVRRDYDLIRGDDNQKPITLARAVYDGVLTVNDATVTSATASFAAGTDEGAKVYGVGVPHGATISTVTNGTTVELSAVATVSTVLDREQKVDVDGTVLRGLVILARDVTGWSFTSQIRRSPQLSGSPLGTATVTSVSLAKGQLLWVCPDTVSDDLPVESWYSIRGVRTSDGFVKTYQWGRLTTGPVATVP